MSYHCTLFIPFLSVLVLSSHDICVWAFYAVFQSKILGVSLPTVVRHRDGTSLAALVQVKTVLLDNGQSLFCLWIQRDASMEDDSLCRLDQSYLDISHSLYNMDSLRPAASEHEIPVVRLCSVRMLGLGWHCEPDFAKCIELHIHGRTIEPIQLSHGMMSSAVCA